MFAEHFSFPQWQNKSDRALGSTEIAYAQQLSHRLEAIRRALGDTPLVITSFVRTGSTVRTTGQTSQHADGSAVDVRRPASVSWSMLAELVPMALRDAGFQWGQFIIYPHEGEPGHFHISLPTGSARGAVLAQAAGGTYVPFGPAVLAGVPEQPATGAPSVESIAGAIALGALVLGLALWVNA